MQEEALSDPDRHPKDRTGQGLFGKDKTRASVKYMAGEWLVQRGIPDLQRHEVQSEGGWERQKHECNPQVQPEDNLFILPKVGRKCLRKALTFSENMHVCILAETFVTSY